MTIPSLIKMLILLLSLISRTIQTKMTLQSYPQTPQQNVEIPEIYNHPFSCELLFFVVYNYKFIVNITQVTQNVQSVFLTVWGANDTAPQYNRSRVVYNNSAAFVVDFKSLNTSQKLEMIMNFNLSYTVAQEMETKVITQQRKAYILFNDKLQQNYILRLPTWTLIVTTAIGLMLILTLPWNIQYRKFLPITFNMLSCIVYIVLLIIATYLQMFFDNNPTIFAVQRIVMGIFSFVCMIMYSQDLLMLITDRNNITFLVAFIFTTIVLFFDNFATLVQDAWFLNDIIAIMMAGAFIKFFIIRKMKKAIWALALMWIFCLLREFAKQFHLQKFDQGFGIRVLPIFVQLPTNWMDDKSSLSCSAFGNSKVISVVSQIICFGLILNYCKRIDLCLSTQFYRVLASAIAILCVAAELGFNLLENDLPVIEVMSVLLFYPIAVGAMLFFANKRGEWAEVWDGSFYDMAVNRASIQRQVSFSLLQSQFGRQWIINSNDSQLGQKKTNKRLANKSTMPNIK